jgi:hypothetical protein
MEQEKACANHVSDKGFISKIYKDLRKSVAKPKSKQMNNPRT